MVPLNRASLQKKCSIQYNEASFQVTTIPAYVRRLKLNLALKLNQHPFFEIGSHCPLANDAVDAKVPVWRMIYSLAL